MATFQDCATEQQYSATRPHYMSVSLRLLQGCVAEAHHRFDRAYGVPDTTNASGVSDSFGLMLRPRIDCAGRSGVNENVMGFSL